jgi:tetratricopeptide (TPR) repeat protein
MSKRLIAKGIIEIQKVISNSNSKITHINNAEGIFRDIEENYTINSINAYNQYGIAYLKVTEYNLALQKLSKSLSINPNHPSTLYYIGLFFNNISDDYFNHIDHNLLSKSVQFPKTITMKVKYDYALFFYCKSIIVDNKNIESIKSIKELISSK